MLQSKPEYHSIKPPDNYLRQKLWYVSESDGLESFVMLCIVLNIITMAMTYETATDEYNNVLNNINLFFTSVFILEAVMKLFAYG